MRSLLLLALLPLTAVAQVCTEDATCAPERLCTAPPRQALTCHRRCQLGCEPKERCTVLRAPDSERSPKEKRRYVCTEESRRLCRPCEADADCDGFLDRCLVLMSGEKACGRDCSWDDQCPRGYRCADPGGLDGREAKRQCLPEAGCCACDQGFFIPAERPPDPAAAASAGGAPGGAPRPAPAPTSSSMVPMRPGRGGRPPGWTSPTAGSPSMVPSSPTGPPTFPGTGTSPRTFGTAPSPAATPAVRGTTPTSPHTTAGSVPAPTSKPSSTSSTPRPAPATRAVVK